MAQWYSAHRQSIVAFGSEIFSDSLFSGVAWVVDGDRGQGVSISSSSNHTYHHGGK